MFECHISLTIPLQHKELPANTPLQIVIAQSDCDPGLRVGNDVWLRTDS